MRQQEISPEYYRQAEQTAQNVLQFLEQNHGIQPREYPESGLIMELLIRRIPRKRDFFRF